MHINKWVTIRDRVKKRLLAITYQTSNNFVNYYKTKNNIVERRLNYN